jgi:hypothetical protein
METIIVFIDDAAHARQQLAPLCAQPEAEAATPVHWVLVACAPRMTQRISKWVSHSARKLFVAVSPWLRHQGHRTSEIVAKVPLAELTTELQARYAGARTLDARRPKHDAHMATGADAPKQPWALPGTLGGLGLGIGMLAMLGAE